MADAIDIGSWVTSVGLLAALAAIGVIVFAESGLLIGIFLPGDSLLFACGIFIAQGDIPLLPVLLVIAVGAVAGDNTGYFFGKAAGKRLIKKKDSGLFRQEYLRRAETYFAKYGHKTVLMARFVPYIRTFTPIVAGMSHMRRREFMLYNVLGAVSWTVITVLVGYWLGKKIPNLQQYLLPAVAVGIVLVFSPAAWHLWRAGRR